MDKKQLITVSALGALIVALVCFVVFSSESTERLTKNQVLRIADEIYEVEDVEKYLRIASSESGDINATYSDLEKGSYYESIYQPRKAYSSVADEKKILFPEEELNKAKEDFTKKSNEFAQYGISENDYIEYREDQYKEENLNNNFTTYFQLPDEDYNEMISGYSGDELKTYTFRLMKFSYEEPVSGESGDILESGDIVADEHEGHNHSGDELEEKEDRSKATMLIKAQTALEAVKSGDDFETVAKEYADMDYIINENGFKMINGEVLTQVVPIIQNQMSFATGSLLVPPEVFEKMKTCEIGGYTEIIEASDASGYYFAKVEKVEDGFVGEADKEFRSVLLSSLQQEIDPNTGRPVYWDNLVYTILDIEINQSALVKYLYK